MTASEPSVRRRRAISSAVFAALLLTASLLFRRELVTWFSRGAGGAGAPAGTGTTKPTEATAASGDIDHYTCPMHPSVKENKPGTCPICRMDLIPVTKSNKSRAS